MKTLRRQTLEVPINQVDMGERARKVYQNVEALAKSIQSRGLLNRPNAYIQKSLDKPYKLMAGGRRYKAFQLLQEWGETTTIPLDVWPEDITELEARYIELIENKERENLTWQEEVALTDQIHKLEFGTTVKETAETLKTSPSTVSRDLKLAKAIQEVPELAKCDSKEEAMKVLNRAEEKLLQRELAKRVEKKNAAKGVDRTKKNMMDAFIVGDTFEKIAKVPDKMINLISLDPDYNIDFTSERKTTQGRFQADYNEWKQERHQQGDSYEEYMFEVLSECYRVLKDPGWLLCWHSTTQAEMIYQTMLKVGFDAKRHPLVWIKPGKSGRVSNPTHSFTVDYECCLYARKGDAHLVQQGPSSIFTYPSVRNNIHPCEKPVPLLEDLFKLFCDPGASILAPFLGSGNDIIAAANCGMTAIGFELSETFKDAFVLRVDKWELPTAKGTAQNG